MVTVASRQKKNENCRPSNQIISRRSLFLYTFQVRHQFQRRETAFHSFLFLFPRATWHPLAGFNDTTVSAGWMSVCGAQGHHSSSSSRILFLLRYLCAWHTVPWAYFFALLNSYLLRGVVGWWWFVEGGRSPRGNSDVEQPLVRNCVYTWVITFIVFFDGFRMMNRCDCSFYVRGNQNCDSVPYEML